MKTSLLFDSEPVADGGFFVRLVLGLDGGAGEARGATSGSVGKAGPLPVSPARLAARNIQVAVRPGRDAEFIQMTHTFESGGAGRLLTIVVGDLYCVDRIRIRMDALVGPQSRPALEWDVAKIVILSHVHGVDGGVELKTVHLPVRLSSDGGGRVLPDLGSMSVSGDGLRPPDLRRRHTDDRDAGPPQCA